MLPGSQFCLNTNKLKIIYEDEIKEKDFTRYINEYAKMHNENFEEDSGDIKKILNKLKNENIYKLKLLNNVKFNELYSVFFFIDDYFDYCIKVDFNNKKVEKILYNQFKSEKYFYKISAPMWLYKKVLYKEITWTDFSLTLRPKIKRKPDIYSSMVQAFLLAGYDDCKYLSEEYGNERIIVSDNKNNYEINRFCPHMGADLKECKIIDSQYIICPRHGWKFDLNNDGKYKKSKVSLESKKINI